MPCHAMRLLRLHWRMSMAMVVAMAKRMTGAECPLLQSKYVVRKPRLLIVLLLGLLVL